MSAPSSLVDGWDIVEDPWNHLKLKSRDRKSTMLVKEILLADGGTAFRCMLYDCELAPGMNREDVSERMAVTKNEIPRVVGELARARDRYRTEPTG